MKILMHERFGDPGDVLQLVSIPEPELRPLEVAVRIEAAPIHAGDLKNIAGEKLMFREVGDGQKLEVRLPQVPGIEGVGRVVRIGSAVNRFKPGDRVLLPWQCGSWRDLIHAEQTRLMPAPEGDAVQLSLMVNAFTADFALRDLAPLEPGDWFLQNGANSNVGRILIRLAKQRGIRTLNVVRRPELIADLKGSGADVVVVDGPDLAQRVRAEVGNVPLRIALDGIAGAATGRLAECLSDGGTIANVGMMSGEACSIPPWILLYRRIRLIGYYAGFNRTQRSPQEEAEVIAGLARGMADGTLSTPVAGVYPLEEYREAVAHELRSGAEREGKVVFVPNA